MESDVQSEGSVTGPAAVRVVAAVLRRAGRVLACRRRLDAGFGPGRWEFPGGKLEAGETASAALQRELREELGISAAIGPVLAATRHRYPDGSLFELTFYQVQRYRGRLINRAFEEVRWCTAPELAALDFLEADRPLLERLRRDPANLSTS